LYFSGISYSPTTNEYYAQFYIGGYPNGQLVGTTTSTSAPSQTSPPLVILSYGSYTCNVRLVLMDRINIIQDSSCPVADDYLLKGSVPPSSNVIFGISPGPQHTAIKDMSTSKYLSLALGGIEYDSNTGKYRTSFWFGGTTNGEKVITEYATLGQMVDLEY